MKKILANLAFGAILVSSLNADIIRAEIGAGIWSQTPSGNAYYNGSVSGLRGNDTLQENKNTSSYVWAFVKHPVPVLPNLRLEYVNINANGKASGEWSGLGIPSGLNSDSTVNMKQYDIIPYYNILDNTFWITLDVGLDAKIIYLDYEIAQKGIFSGYKYKSVIQIPLGYLRTRVQIPTTGLAVESDIKYIKYAGSIIYDARAKIDYTFDISPLIQPALEIGYRAQKIKIDDSSTSIKTDINFRGPYLGLFLRF